MQLDTTAILNGLISYACIVIIITFHEFGHAWASWRCGDDTARLQGRVTLNPVAHMDMIGTVMLPLLVVFLSAAGSGLGRFIIGWGKPVPVNVSNLRRPHIDDLLVAMAGPLMNVILAFLALAGARLGVAMNISMLAEAGFRLAEISMFLCFFNLIPVPPLDGSYLLKHFVGMSHASFLRFSQFGFFIVILIIQLQPVQNALTFATRASLEAMAWIWRF